MRVVEHQAFGAYAVLKPALLIHRACGLPGVIAKIYIKAMEIDSFSGLRGRSFHRQSESLTVFSCANQAIRNPATLRSLRQ